MNTSTRFGLGIVTALFVTPLWGCSDDGVPFDDGANTAAGTSGEDTGGPATGGTFTTTGGGGEETSGSATTATTSPTSGSTDPDEGGSDGLDGEDDSTGGTHGDSESTGGETGDDAGTTTGDLDGCSDNEDCEATEFCEFPDGQCGLGSPGSCTIRPEVCNAIYMPVCGCDGQTHSNACYAAGAGVDVASQGPCP
jgi:hypothetical protein